MFLIQVYVGCKFCPSFWKLLVFEFLLGVTGTLLHLTFAFEVKIFFLPDALQLLMLFVRTLTYLETKLFVSLNHILYLNYSSINCIQFDMCIYLHCIDHICIVSFCVLYCLCSFVCSVLFECGMLFA
jgi:hypothetical protein